MLGGRQIDDPAQRRAVLQRIERVAGTAIGGLARRLVAVEPRIGDADGTEAAERQAGTGVELEPWHRIAVHRGNVAIVASRHGCRGANAERGIDAPEADEKLPAAGARPGTLGGGRVEDGEVEDVEHDAGAQETRAVRALGARLHGNRG